MREGKLQREAFINVNLVRRSEEHTEERYEFIDEAGLRVKSSHRSIDRSIQDIP
jgi:hypothetical protein